MGPPSGVSIGLRVRGLMVRGVRVNPNPNYNPKPQPTAAWYWAHGLSFGDEHRTFGLNLIPDYWTVYDSPCNLPCACYIVYNILVVTISCKSQGADPGAGPSFGSEHRPFEWGWRAVGLYPPPCLWWWRR